MRRIGLTSFVIGLAMFAGAELLVSYRLDDSGLAALAKLIPQRHATKIAAELTPLQDVWFSGGADFAAAVERKVIEAGEGLEPPLYEHERQTYVSTIQRVASTGPLRGRPLLFFLLSIGLASFGALLFFLPRLSEPAGIKNDGVMFSRVRSRGALGIATGVGIIAFYIALYFFPTLIHAQIRLTDPLSLALRGHPADRWFFYGTLYTFAVGVMGVRMLLNYRHSRYHVVRTLSVIFFQLGFAFLLPSVLAWFNAPSLDLKNAWPLDYAATYDYRVDDLLARGPLGMATLVWSVALALIVVPAMSALVGKRWYCSWVCGCGGLAETLGDPWRHQSNKSLRAWRIERWSVHGVLVFALVMSAVVLLNRFTGALGDVEWRVQSWYGFLIGSVFAGVVGTGFYPLMGNRVWCRFGCPLAAILGLVQKFKSRFRITVNGGQCISCGNCSTYCEMGIDVRAYAQRGQNIIRASCVGCGVCAAVCPRGVLRLENGPTDGRYNDTSLVQLGGGRID